VKPFFDETRKQFGKLNQKQVNCLSALFTATEGLPVMHRAYVLGTAWHETWCFKFTKEIWGPTKQQLKYEPPHPIAKRLGNTLKGDGKRFMGRGFPQLTGRSNYVWASKVTGQDLVAMPDLAEAPEISAKIIVTGMVTGAFTGKSMSDYKTYEAMRRVVNGTDKAALIAGYARKFETAIKAATQ
jgi:putative chitinase